MPDKPLADENTAAAHALVLKLQADHAKKKAKKGEGEAVGPASPISDMFAAMKDLVDPEVLHPEVVLPDPPPPPPPEPLQSLNQIAVQIAMGMGATEAPTFEQLVNYGFSEDVIRGEFWDLLEDAAGFKMPGFYYWPEIDGRRTLVVDFLSNPAKWPADRAMLTAEALHERWWKLDPRPKHFLVPLVATWLAGPRQAEPFRPIHKASVPLIHRTNPDEVNLPAVHYRGRTFGSPDQKELPAMLTAESGGPSSWLLYLWDRCGGNVLARHGTVPWEFHLAIGAMAHVNVSDRDGSFRPVKLATEEVIGWKFPQGWRPENKRRDFSQFTEALDRLNQGMGWVYIPGVGRVQMVGASIIPVNPTDPVVEFVVRIPPGASTGFAIDWPTLCRYASGQNGRKYRAYLALSAVVNETAHHGHPLTRQIEHKGKLVDNKAARFIKSYTEAELADLIGLDGSTGYGRKRAREVTEDLEADHAFEFVKEGRFWRIFGPKK